MEIQYKSYKSYKSFQPGKFLSIFYRAAGVFRPPNYLRNYNSYDNETCTVS